MYLKSNKISGFGELRSFPAVEDGKKAIKSSSEATAKKQVREKN